jgi:hypothetical protein
VKPYLEKKPSQKRAGGIAEGVDPEFKPQYCKNKPTNVGRGALLRCWWEYKLVQHLWKSVWRFLQNVELPYDPATKLLVMYLKEYKIY